MNSSKLLRVGVPALGLCVFALFQTGCRPEVLKNRGAVPPAERENFQDAEDDNKNFKDDDSFDAFDAPKKAADKKVDDKNTVDKKTEKDGKNFKLHSSPDACDGVCHAYVIGNE